MITQNIINIVGTVASEPRMITTQSGLTFCAFRVASGERRYDRQQQKWVDGATNCYGVTAFRSLAEHAKESLRKGERVIVSGRLRVRQWEREEKSGTSVEIEADALGHDLRWGVSRFEKRPVGGDATTGPESASGSEGSADAVSGTGTPQSAWNASAADPDEPKEFERKAA